MWFQFLDGNIGDNSFFFRSSWKQAISREKKRRFQLAIAHISFQMIDMALSKLQKWRDSMHLPLNFSSSSSCAVFVIISNVRKESKANENYFLLVSFCVSSFRSTNKWIKPNRLETKVRIIWVAFCFGYYSWKEKHREKYLTLISRVCVDITFQKKWRKKNGRKEFDGANA